MKHSTFFPVSRPSHIEILVLPTDRDVYLYNIVYRAYSLFYQLKNCLDKLRIFFALKSPDYQNIFLSARFGHLTKIIL